MKKETSIACPIDPEGTKVIVVPDLIAEKSAGGIWLSPKDREVHQLAVTHGTLVGIGPRAEITWNDGDGRSERPGEIGDRVVYVKYAGSRVRWGDGKVFQILQDQDVIAQILEEPPADVFVQEPRKPVFDAQQEGNKQRIVIPGR